MSVQPAASAMPFQFTAPTNPPTASGTAPQVTPAAALQTTNVPQMQPATVPLNPVQPVNPVPLNPGQPQATQATNIVALSAQPADISVIPQPTSQVRYSSFASVSGAFDPYGGFKSPYLSQSEGYVKIA